MLPIVLIGLAAVIAVFVVIVAMQPSAFRITRSAAISAPAGDVFAQVNDFHNWEAWSPWENIDPNMKRTYTGPPAGTGATRAWTGNSQAGEGSSTITESRPNDLIRMKLEMIKPFAATNDVEFTFKPQGDQTVVSWTMSGQNNFMLKAFSLFMNMDKMLGGEFEKGLAQLKTLTESAAAKQEAAH